MLPLITIEGLSKTYGAQSVFESLSIIVQEREKIGLIGHNGSGKSTLLRILAGAEYPDDGTITHHKKIQVGYLPQNPEFAPDDTPVKVVTQAMAPRLARIHEYESICAKLAEAKNSSEMEKLCREQETLHAEIESHGGWSTQHDVEGMLGRLKLPADLLHSPMQTLSGGQRRRVALARVLVERPDLLMLDEPTNHLDMDTILWLESFLREYPAAVILVTHDRAFLDAIVDRIVEIHHSELLSFAGNYRDFVEQKAALMDLRKKEQEKYANLLVTELEWLRRGPKARGTKSKSRIERVYEIQQKAQVTHEATLNLSFTADSRLGNIIIQAEDISKSYDQPVFKPFDFTLRKEDRCAVVGPNGCGKTTLLNVLTRKIPSDTGKLVVGKNTHIAYLSQQRDELDPSKSVYDSLGDGDHVYVNGEAVHKRGFLCRFLFDVNEQDKLVSTLSGGEKCRLLFARMVCARANLLVLDEPTNDLDMDSLQTLENALENYEGAVLFVTHDRYLINRLATAVLGFDAETRTFVRYDGDYDFYQLCLKRAQQEKASETQQEKPAKKAPQKTDQEKPKKLTYKEAKELEGIEDVIMEAEEEKSRIESEIADPESYKIPNRARELSASLDEINARIEELYERWSYLSSLKG